ncbi:MAG TPA: YSC84-related protein [Terriglobales bacterium]
MLWNRARGVRPVILAVVGIGAVAGSLQLGAAAASPSSREQDVQRVQAATAIFRDVFQGPGREIPESVLRNGECVAIIPGYKTFALTLGGSYGKGIAMCRLSAATEATNTPAATTTPRRGTGGAAAAPGQIPGWSAPIFISIGGASLGPQIGVDSADVVMVFQTRRGLEAMLNNKLRLGASAAAAAGPIGRRVEAATDATVRAQAVSYAHSRGLFVGVNLNGAIVQPDESGNRAMYPHAYWQDVLDGKLATPTAARPLISELERSPFTNPNTPNPLGSALPAVNAAIGPGLERPRRYTAGISYDHLSSSSGLGGWNLLGGWRANRRNLDGLSLIAQIGRVSNSQSVLTTTIKTSEWSYLFGPEFDMPHRLLDPYAHVLFGAAHLNQKASSPGNPSTSTGFNSFAWEVGAGIQLNIERRFSVRLFELDLLHTKFNNSGHNAARIEIGVSVHF